MAHLAPGSVRLLETALDAIEAPVVVWAPDGEVLQCNAAYRKALGYDARATSMPGRSAVIHPDDAAAVAQRLEMRLGGDIEVWRLPCRLMTSNRRVIRVELRCTPIVEDGRYAGDIVEHVTSDEALSLRQALDEQAAAYHHLFQHISEAIWSLDRQGVMSSANPAAERLFGRSLEELQRTPPGEILQSDGVRGIFELRERFDNGERVPRRVEFQIRRPDGEMRWISGSLLMRHDPQGGFGQAFVVARDITAIKERERHLAERAAEASHQAMVDPLTGLGNRRAFDAALEECRDLMAAGHAPRIFILDLDNLKAVNDVSGHAAGDEAIRLMARAILERTRAVDQPFRIGGDEFAVIAIEGDGDAISKRLSEPAPFQPPTPWMRASVGWATCGIDALEPAEAVRLADRRMYEMKQARKAACD